MGVDAFNGFLISVLILAGLALSTKFVLGKRPRFDFTKISLYWVVLSIVAQKPRAQAASKVLTPNISDSFWTSNTCDMDITTVQSQGSMSAVSTSIQMHDSHCNSSSNAPSEFVDRGLLLWKQTRQQWTGSRNPEKKAQQLREPSLSWNATYDSLLGSNKPLPGPIPLAEMVDFLVDVWEQEGMYD